MRQAAQTSTGRLAVLPQRCTHQPGGHQSCSRNSSGARPRRPSPLPALPIYLDGPARPPTPPHPLPVPPFPACHRQQRHPAHPSLPIYSPPLTAPCPLNTSLAAAVSGAGSELRAGCCGWAHCCVGASELQAGRWGWGQGPSRRVSRRTQAPCHQSSSACRPRGAQRQAGGVRHESVNRPTQRHAETGHM